jgi:exportin-5
MVSFVAFLLPHDGHVVHANDDIDVKPTLRDIVLSDPTILEPLILFCTHALRMRDTRCCVAVCKIFRNIIPLFQSNDPPAHEVREFICTEVLKAGITSLNEPYFADIQKDLATLIAQIILLYAPSTGTPRDVLLSLPDMSDAKVDKAIGRICKTSSERTLRSVVLDLLEGVRGVSIHEAGKITSKKAAKKTAVPQQYMEVEQRPSIVNGNDAGLEDVAGLFGDA